MTAKSAGRSTQVELDVCVGKAGHLVGHLTYLEAGPREFSTFGYADSWLADAMRFEVSPDLPLQRGHQTRKASKDDSSFFFALADTEPDGWGRRLIARAHARERKENASLKALTELDYLCAVDDFSRIGALRLRDAKNGHLRTIEEGHRTTPPLIELEHIMAASRAVERSEETTNDLKYLLGKGTSLGGIRPKCTVLSDDGTLALAKFPSVNDARSVTRGEGLALRLAALAGIEVANARVVTIQTRPVALIRRFDRTTDQGRIAYLSGTSMLQARRNDEHAYTEVVDAMRSHCVNPVEDARQLWRRLAFNHLITNVDDHLQNIGFLYVGQGQWRLSPAFDLNPFPDKDRESKTWLTEETDPITSSRELLAHAAYFNLDPTAAQQTFATVVAAVERWREVAQSAVVGLTAAELEDFTPAFEGRALVEARTLLA